MALGYAVNGPAIVYVGTGSSAAFEQLGFTPDGVDIDVNVNLVEVPTDVMGGQPQDVQKMPCTGRIVANLISLDTAVMNKVVARGDATSVGLVDTPGLMLGAGGFLFKVGIASSAGVPWTFASCVCRPGFGTRLATKANPFRVEFFAFPFAAPTVTAGKDTAFWGRGAVP